MRNVKPPTLSMLLEVEEYRTVLSLLKHRDLNSLNPIERQAYVEALAGALDPNQALILYEKFEMNDPGVLAKIHLFLGNREQALEWARRSESPFLEASILLAMGTYGEAQSSLQQQPMTPKSYYLMGCYYAHMKDTKKAIFNLEKAVRGFERVRNSAMATVSLANLANQYNTIGSLDQAEKLYSSVIQRLMKARFSSFPELSSRVLINCGRHHLDLGRLSKSLRYLWRAQKLLKNAEGAPGYVRVSLFLAYNFMELGHYKKSIQLLKALSPQHPDHKADRLRYLAMAYLRSGLHEKALQSLEAAQMETRESDIFSLNHLAVVQAELFSRLHCWSEAEALVTRTLQAFKNSKDFIGYHYCLSKWAWLSRNEKFARISLKFHSRKKLGLEMSADLITLSIAAIKKGNLAVAQGYLSKANCKGLPVQEGYRLFLQAVLFCRRGNRRLLDSYLERAYKISASREMNLLSALILYLKLTSNLRPEAFSDLHQKFQSHHDLLDENDKKTFNFWVFELKMADDGFFFIQSRDRTIQVDSLALQSYLHSDRHTVIDLHAGSLHVRGKKRLWNSKNSSQWSILQALANQSDRRLSREDLCLKALKKKTYHPLRDDHLTQMAIQRLRKTLGDGPLISCVNGAYQLHLDDKTIIIKKWDVLTRERFVEQEAS